MLVWISESHCIYNIGYDDSFLSQLAAYFSRAYFNNTPVQCMLVGRAKVEGVLASEFVGTCYTHHQKTVICDAALEDGSDLRRVIGESQA